MAYCFVVKFREKIEICCKDRNKTDKMQEKSPAGEGA